MCSHQWQFLLVVCTQNYTYFHCLRMSHFNTSEQNKLCFTTWQNIFVCELLVLNLHINLIWNYGFVKEINSGSNPHIYICMYVVQAKIVIVLSLYIITFCYNVCLSNTLCWWLGKNLDFELSYSPTVSFRFPV